MKILELQQEYLDEVARIHMDSLPNDFLPLFGKDFLANIFYKHTLNNDFAKCFISVENERCNGFLLLTTDSGKFLTDLIKKNFFQLGYFFIKSSFSDLRIIPFAFSLAFSMISKGEKNEFVEIYIIAVDKNARGQGIGESLVKKSINHASENEFCGIQIKTLKTNRDWIGFFLRNEWSLSNEFAIGGNAYVMLEKLLCNERGQ